MKDLKPTGWLIDDNGAWQFTTKSEDLAIAKRFNWKVAPLYSEQALADLQGQNDELRASNESLRKELEYFNNRVERGTITSKATYRRFKVALDKTPTQSLADIRAEAIRECSDWLLLISDKAPSDSELGYNIMSCVDLIRDYANKIKGDEG